MSPPGRPKGECRRAQPEGPSAGRRGAAGQVKTVLAAACTLLALTGCSQWRTYRCVSDTVSRNEPYQSQTDRDDSEALAWQACRQQAAGEGR